MRITSMGRRSVEKRVEGLEGAEEDGEPKFLPTRVSFPLLSHARTPYPTSWVFLNLWVRPGKRAGASVAYPESRPQTAGAVRSQ